MQSENRSWIVSFFLSYHFTIFTEQLLNKSFSFFFILNVSEETLFCSSFLSSFWELVWQSPSQKNLGSLSTWFFLDLSFFSTSHICSFQLSDFYYAKSLSFSANVLHPMGLFMIFFTVIVGIPFHLELLFSLGSPAMKSYWYCSGLIKACF